MSESILVQIDDLVREATPEEAEAIRAAQTDHNPLGGDHDNSEPA